MMGRQSVDQGQVFYEFRLGDRVPADHLLRRIDVIVAAALADLHQKLAAHGIRSERRLREEIQEIARLRSKGRARNIILRSLVVE